jgi:hypothetical protein
MSAELCPARRAVSGPKRRHPELEVVAIEFTFCLPLGAAGGAAMLRRASEPTPSIFRPTKSNGVGMIACPVGDWRQLSRVDRA